MFDHTSSPWRNRIVASALHLGISLLIAAFAATLVFTVWYPFPYSELSGGRELFLIVVAVDVILGPLITLIIFNLTKPRKELRRDLILIVIIQLSALSYGLWTVCIARPVYMVFEYDRFRVIHAIDVDPSLLAKAPSGLEELPLTGPALLGLRPFKNEREKMDATLAALQGVSLASQPELWQPYERALPQVLAVAKPLEELKERFKQDADSIDKLLGAKGRAVGQVAYLPLVGRKSFWTVLLDRTTGEILAYIPLDSF